MENRIATMYSTAESKTLDFLIELFNHDTIVSIDGISMYYSYVIVATCSGARDPQPQHADPVD